MADTAQNEFTGPKTAYTAPEDQSKQDERTKFYGLIKHLADDVALLLRKELALAASEVSTSVNDTKKGMAGLVSGSVVLNSGFIFLLAAATLGLAEVMQAWLAALIVGAVATVIGLIMVQAGKKKFQASSFRPDHTLEEMHKDRATVRGVSS
ncbi:phage holin family protein [Marinobacter fonticola]|uniref:phage holin family protein n=1 Tax=Marinobacter fonticola TaxID=2603215 RepID=UPI0011E826E8|nr:phage holin family protein [Marinobacter fonticola]